MENTETVTINKNIDGYMIVVQHDQSGSSYGLHLSNKSYQQLCDLIIKSLPVTGESEAINKAIIEELQSLLSSGVHPEYLPEKINDRIAELKGDKSCT